MAHAHRATAMLRLSCPHRRARKIVAYFGSSSTGGKGQAFDWVAELRRRRRDEQF